MVKTCCVCISFLGDDLLVKNYMGEIEKVLPFEWAVLIPSTFTDKVFLVMRLKRFYTLGEINSIFNSIFRGVLYKVHDVKKDFSFLFQSIFKKGVHNYDFSLYGNISVVDIINNLNTPKKVIFWTKGPK